MEEIFANSGYHLIAEMICKNLEPDSFQKLVSTCKTIQNFSAVISDSWLKKCQEKGLCKTNWTHSLKVLKQPKFHWNFGIILHRVNHEYSTNILKPKLHPLEASAKSGQVEIVKTLLQKVYYRDMEPNQFPFYKDILEGLMGKNEKVRTFKSFKVVLKNILKHKKSLISDLIETPYGIFSKEITPILEVLMNKPNSLGNTPMHSYAYHGNRKESIEIVKFVAEMLDVNSNPPDAWGTTPMHIAVNLGHVEFVKALAPHWHNYLNLDGDAKTAYQIAEDKGHQEIMEILNKYTLG